MSRQSLEERRLMAAEDLRSGMKQAAVARHYGVSRTTVMRWARAVRGGRSLKARRASGRPAFVSHVLIQGLWARHPHCSGPQLAELVERTFGVRYDTDHMFKLTRKFRATQQAEASR